MRMWGERFKEEKREVRDFFGFFEDLYRRVF